MPLVSILVACYRAADTIKRAVDSALAQAGVEVEVIVVDDCSPDDSVAVIMRHFDRHRSVRLVRSETRSGPSGARNTAMKMATGEWLAILDADDWMAPGRLRELIAFAEDCKCNIVADPILYCRTNTAAPYAVRFRDCLVVGGATTLSVADVIRNGMGVLKPVFRRHLISNGDIRYDPDFSRGEDLLFLCRLLLSDSVIALYKRAMYFKQEIPGSLTKKNQVQLLVEMKKIFDRLLALPELEMQHEAAAAIGFRRSLVDRAHSWAKIKATLRGQRHIVRPNDLFNAVIHLFYRRAKFHFEKLDR